MATTTNYGWTTPDDTALVKDGASAIRTLGSSVDTTTKNLNPETTLGDVSFRSSSSNVNTRLGIGSSGQVLTVAAGVPSWATPTTGDIEGVTAGTGITGGGTSGTVTITNDMATTITASGDIVVGTGSGTYDNLPIGTTNQVLTADTTVSPYKIKWATPAGGGGKVLQVVQATTTTAVDVTSTTMTDTNLTASITPSLATSKVLVLVSQNAGVYRLTSVAAGAMQLMRGATAIFTATGANNNSAMKTGSTGGTELYMTGYVAMHYLDSPATTSATTYKTQARVQTTANSASFSFQDAGTSSIILLEIGA